MNNLRVAAVVMVLVFMVFIMRRSAGPDTTIEYQVMTVAGRNSIDCVATRISAEHTFTAPGELFAGLKTLRDSIGVCQNARRDYGWRDWREVELGRVGPGTDPPPLFGQLRTRFWQDSIDVCLQVKPEDPIGTKYSASVAIQNTKEENVVRIGDKNWRPPHNVPIGLDPDVGGPKVMTFCARSGIPLDDFAAIATWKGTLYAFP